MPHTTTKYYFVMDPIEVPRDSSFKGRFFQKIRVISMLVVPFGQGRRPFVRDNKYDADDCIRQQDGLLSLMERVHG